MCWIEEVKNIWCFFLFFLASCSWNIMSASCVFSRILNFFWVACFDSRASLLVLRDLTFITSQGWPVVLQGRYNFKTSLFWGGEPKKRGVSKFMTQQQ